MRSSNSNNSRRRRLAQGAKVSFSNCARPGSLNSFFLPAIALVHRQRLQLIHDPRAHLHHAMSVPQQLSQISVFRARYPDLRKVIFPHQSKYKESIIAVGLPLFYSLCFNLCGVAHPNLDTQLCQQSLEPAGIPGSLHAYPDADSALLQIPIESLRLSIAVVQFQLTTLSRLFH
jgi:hypothetical protein